MASRFTFAGRLERLFANLLDTLILLLPSLTLAALFGEANKGLLVLVLFIMNLVYDVSFTSSAWQATPGKRILNMYIIHADGSPMTRRDAVERFLAFVLPSLPIYSSMLPEQSAQILVLWLSVFWFMPILTTVERTGIHDMICRTRVIVGKAGLK